MKERGKLSSIFKEASRSEKIDLALLGVAVVGATVLTAGAALGAGTAVIAGIGVMGAGGQGFMMHQLAQFNAPQKTPKP